MLYLRTPFCTRASTSPAFGGGGKEAVPETKEGEEEVPEEEEGNDEVPEEREGEEQAPKEESLE